MQEAEGQADPEVLTRGVLRHTMLEAVMSTTRHRE
jgi:hypothetical protein